ncbi:hypothetical protein B0H16DRAFT_1745327 [Mycena metata]|uniref:Uncharacterized protein n=1 Tax=Mycena metata TaxID=1033252 RepID=A0AAD7MCV5_9AGAR|nr:hypothetical protein B0H16DRAFT_1745327 [Mycena metata]
MTKRKSSKSSPAPSDGFQLVDRSSLAAPWSFFCVYQSFSDIVHYFAKENIRSSDSAAVVPLLNTLWPLLIEFYARFTADWAPDIAAYVAAVTVACRQLIRKHLKPRLADFQDMLWDYPDELQEILDKAGVKSPTTDFELPRVRIQTRTPLSLSKVDNDGSEDEPISKKPRMDKPPGRAASEESVAAAPSPPLPPPPAPPVTVPRELRELRSATTTTPSKPGGSTIKVEKKPEVEKKVEVHPSKPTLPAASLSRAKGKGTDKDKEKEKDSEHYLTVEEKEYADKHPPPSTREEMLKSLVYSETAPPGPWAKGQARPLPAQLRAPLVLVGDWLSPMLWSRSPCKCLSCINRLLDCSDGDFRTRCAPCVKGNIKCSCNNTDEEDILMHEALCPLQALSSDEFVRVLQRAVESRRLTEMHYRIFLRSMEDLERANRHAVLTYVNTTDMGTPEGMEMFFEDPADKEHVNALCQRILSETSLQSLQLAHLEANPSSGVRRLDESQPHSVANTFHTPLPTPILARPVDPELRDIPASLIAGVPVLPAAPVAGPSTPSSAPPTFGQPNNLLPPLSAVTITPKGVSKSPSSA